MLTADMREPLKIWIIALSASLCLTAELHGVKDYEVIRPIRLHAVYKRGTQLSRPSVLQYGMQVGGRDVVMHLEKNEGLISRDYTETHYREDGERLITSPDNLDLCYYHGRIINDSNSLVSMSTCDGLRGYLKTAAQHYLIEPLSGSDTGDHALFKYESLNVDPPTCGVTNTSWDPDYPPSTSKTRSRGRSLVQEQKYNELYLVADNRMYQKWNSGQNTLRKRIFDIVNFVNMVYKPLSTFIALIGLEVWTDNDKITVVAPAGQTLDAFTAWRNNNLMKVKVHDNAHLITGIDFEGATVGLAYIGTLCSAHSTGVIQDHNTNNIAVGATLAHEMGHNLGMNHDTSSCICSSSSCIMSPALSYDIPRLFSSCSNANYEQFLSSRNPTCLLNKPDYRSLVTEPVCGNGFLEQGEQCDCGTVEECTNPCCNATTCSLAQGSECGAGECCENCKLLPTSRECRQKRDECDLAEYCTGSSTECPEDVFAVNGIPCKDGQSYCFNGQCPTALDQCLKLWGANAVLAKSSCFDQNTRGTYYGFCTRPKPQQYIGCQKKDIMCGKLFCDGGTENPSSGRMLMFPGCKASFSDNPDTDYGQVDSGIKCGEERVCNNRECVDLETAYHATNCSARCPGNGVCNHRRECQCLPGWLPPNCNQKDSSQISSGLIIAIATIICLLVLAVIVGIFIFRKRKDKGSQRRSPALVKHEGVNNPGFRQQQPVPSLQVHIQRPTAPPPPAPTKSNSSHTPVDDLAAARKALKPPPRV